MKARPVFSALAVVALMLAACGPAEAPDAFETSTLAPDAALAAERDALISCGQVTAEGYCGVRFGAPVQTATRAFPVKLEGYEAREGADLSPERCYELFPVSPVSGLSFLAERGVIGRIDVISETVRTAEDFGVGTPAQALQARYGDAITSAVNVFEPEITDLTLLQGATKFVFEIQNGAVRSWRAGLPPTIDYVAHCS